jgi:hypothetical protein
MKSIFFIFFVLLPGFSCALTLDDLYQSFTARKLKIIDDRDTNIASLGANYTVALKKMQQKYEAAGRLDDALSVKKENDLVTSKTWPIPPLVVGAPRDLVVARKLYIQNHLDFQRQSGRSLMEVAEKMDELLAEKVISLTKEGDLETAKKARAIQEAIAKDELLAEANALIQRVDKDGSAPVAIRIRRVGDDLEVEVRYDSSGKISL